MNNNDKQSRPSGSIKPKSAVTPPIQPLPKKEDDIRADIAPNSKKSDSNPTL